MKLFPLTVATLLLCSLPAVAQTELERLREQVEKLTLESAAKAARISELQAQLDKEKARQDQRKGPAPAPTVPEPVETPPSAARAALQALVLPKKEPAPVAPAQLPATPRFYMSFAGADAKVTAVADEIGLVVFSVGSESGVAVGDEFVVSRKGEFVAKVTVDRVDRRWSVGKVTQKTENPRVADDAARNAKGLHYWTAIPGKAVTVTGRVQADEVQSLRKELDEVRAQVRQLTDRLVPSFQGPGVSVEEASEELRAHLGILRGLLVRRVREGSAAEKAGLKANDVVPDLLEAQLVEALESGMPVHVVRKGQAVRLPGAKGR